MSAFEDIGSLLHPTILEGLRQDTPPVPCTVWHSDGTSETFNIDAYPFDTLDTVKQLIASRYKTPEYLPKFTFIGVAKEPLSKIYLPLDYLWFPPGSMTPSLAIQLPSPYEAVQTPVAKFTTSDGSLPPFSRIPRGRSTLEDTFLIPTKTIPSLHIFTLANALSLYKGVQPISIREWNHRFAPFFPNVQVSALSPTGEDIAFGRTLYGFTANRDIHLNKISEYLEERTMPLPELKVSGVQQVRLVLQKRKGEWLGCDSLFYQTRVNKLRPFLRLLPASGTPVTKVFVRGVMPIPALDDPDIILQWAKESSPTEGHDFLTVKYVHRASIGTSCPIYGTVRIFDDGTADLLLQPPKHLKKLEPTHDFRRFRETLTEVLDGFPQKPADFKLGEIALSFQIQLEENAAPFKKSRLLSRLPFFSTFFQVIQSPDNQAMLSLRYKAVSQFATESNLFSFLTQTVLQLEEEDESLNQLASRLQDEFQMSLRDARKTVEKWQEQRGTFTLVVPEDNEFMESFNPGIDIHIFPQHPFYHFHVKRVDSYQSFQRIYSLLALLFVEEDEYFTVSEKAEKVYERQGAAIEERILEGEKEGVSIAVTAEAVTTVPPATATASAAQFFGEEEDAEDAEDADEAETVGETKAEEKTAIVEAKKATRIEEDGKRMVNPKGWFLNKLKEADVNLFGYKPIRKGALTYASFCAANEDRQPSVLSKAKFDRMMEVYEPEISSGELFFNLFPIEGTSNPVVPRGAKGRALEITVMRYGSDPFNQNYYFCPELYCLFDEIMILEGQAGKDEGGFKGSRDRANRPKPPNTCPFCRGTLITNRDAPVQGATVIRRDKKPKSDNRHLYVGFTKTTTQPDNLALPCCHVKHKMLAITDTQFRHIRQVIIDRNVATVLPVRVVEEENQENQEGEDIEEEEEEAVAATGLPIVAGAAGVTVPTDAVSRASESKAIPYAYLLERVHHPTTYILTEEKHPLSPGKFAILPPPFDTYFAQSSSDIIQRAEIRQQLRPKGEGFLRLGTEIGEMEASCGRTAHPTEALLGVLAPLLDRQSIDDVRTRILEVCTPRVFVMANFGNLVHEFYNPTDPDPTHSIDGGNAMDRVAAPPISNRLKTWARDNLQVAATTFNQSAVKRIYNAYARFVDFMKDPKQRKEIRHLTSLLAEPGLLTESGLQLIVLEWSPPKTRQEAETPVSVRCSPYGFSMDRHRESDFAFIWRDDNGFYELMVYTKNEPKHGAVLAKHESLIQWSAFNRRDWPTIVKDRINEYMFKCQSNYRSLYTIQSGVDSMALLPLSVASTTLDGVSGVVRDSYNHVVAVLFPVKGNAVIPLPVVDDGWLPLGQALYLDMYDYKPAPVDVIVTYYRENFVSLFGIYPGYEIKSIVTALIPATGQDGVVAVQLKNGLYVRASPPSPGVSVESIGLGQPVHVEEFEWAVNKELTELDAQCSDGNRPEIPIQRMDELYQQYRYIVSNWLESEDSGVAVRKRMEGVLFSRLPDYEKRKRMEIYFGTLFRSWLAPDAAKWDLPKGYLRKDCRVLDSAESCTGTCSWRAESGTCALHVDEKTPLGGGGRLVNTADLFARRIMDELILFPMRRKELMTQSVGQLVTIKDAVRDGDQYIVPETGLTWLNLLRIDWMLTEPDKPQFYEEMARTKSRGVEETKEPERYPVPPAVLAVLGAGGARYSFWSIPSLASLAILLKGDLEVSPGESRISPSALTTYIKRAKQSIGIIDMEKEEGNRIMFKKSDSPGQTHLAVVVFLPSGLGVLMEQEGNPFITLRDMPANLQAKWMESTVTVARPFRRRPREVLEPAPVSAIAPAPAIATAPAIAPAIASANAKTIATIPEIAAPSRESVVPTVLGTASRTVVAPEATALSTIPEAPELPTVLGTVPTVGTTTLLEVIPKSVAALVEQPSLSEEEDEEEEAISATSKPVTIVTKALPSAKSSIVVTKQPTVAAPPLAPSKIPTVAAPPLAPSKLPSVVAPPLVSAKPPAAASAVKGIVVQKRPTAPTVVESEEPSTNSESSSNSESNSNTNTNSPVKTVTATTKTIAKSKAPTVTVTKAKEPSINSLNLQALL